VCGHQTGSHRQAVGWQVYRSSRGRGAQLQTSIRAMGQVGSWRHAQWQQVEHAEVCSLRIACRQ
jgi:hypothetical protein